jgi:transposase-like protein
MVQEPQDSSLSREGITMSISTHTAQKSNRTQGKVPNGGILSLAFFHWRIMKCFKSSRQLQRFVSIHDPIANLHHFPRNTISSPDHRDLRHAAMTAWREIACVAAA